MKRILAIILAAVLALSLSVAVFAAEEVEIPLDADHVGEGAATVEELTIADGTITANEIGIFALNLPEEVPIDQTIVVHIKGTSDGDFRAWLLASQIGEEKANQATFSNQWKASENGFEAPGEFEKFMELTAEDFDSQGGTSANRVAFKAPSWDSTLENLTLTYVGVIYGSIADVEASAVAEAQPFADAAAAALEAANAATDEAALNAALADAEAAVEALTEKAELGFPGVTAMLNEAKSVVREINNIINSAAADAVVESIQSDVEAVNNALAAAQNAGNDIDAINAALADAKAAADNIAAVAEANNYSEVTSASRDAADAVKQIETLLSNAEEQKKLEEAAAAEEAAQKQKTTTVVIIVIVVVVILVVIVAAVVAAMSKKKKK